MHSAYSKFINQVHCPSMLLLVGSVFIYSPYHWELSEMLRSGWTQFGMLLMAAWYSICFLHKGKVEFSLYGFFWALFFVGTLETLYIFLQITHILPSPSTTFLFSGSFLNPAIAAMLLSLGIPVGLWLSYHEEDRKIRCLIRIVGVCMAVLLILSASRTGLIAAMVACCFVICKEGNKIKAWLRRTNKMVLLAAALAAFFLLCLALYHMRVESANGRILIWKVAADMIAANPLPGYGPNGFDAHYMHWQAEYFANHPDSPYLLLADNVAGPFNEFIGIAINYGLVGLFAVLAAIALVIWLISKRTVDRSLLLGLTVALIIWSIFSYVYRQPFVWVLTFVLVVAALKMLNLRQRIVRLAAIIVLCLSVSAMAYKAAKFCYRAEWHIVQDRSLRGHTLELLPQYAKLYSHLNDDSGFLYNYGAELHYIGRYDESLKILKECEPLYSDYNVQMLIADDFGKLGMIDSAVYHYRYAKRMVPSKFFPLYQEMQLYLAHNDSVSARRVAKEIITKPVKIQGSRSVNKMIDEARDLLD